MDPRPTDRNQLNQLITEVLGDYDAGRSPFDEWMLPEYRILEESNWSNAERARYLTFVAAVDYYKETEGSDGLWQVMYRLWEKVPWLFSPTDLVANRDRSDIESLFAEYEIFDYPSQDADTWYRLAETFDADFDGDPRQLLAKNDFDAVEIKNYLHRHGSQFPYLKGAKICPLWLRLMHEEVHELSSIEQIDIPVDVRIRQITGALLDLEYEDSEESNNEVRVFWGKFCRDYEYVPVHVDQPLWLLAKNWSEGGREYVEEKLAGTDSSPGTNVE